MTSAQLEEMIQQAMDDLHAATGGKSLCADSREGRTLPAAKYHEGQWAALSELRRSGGAAEAESVRERWIAERERLTAQGASRDWIAYASGGADALTAYVELEHKG